MTKTVRTYDAFNRRRYSDPWVAEVNGNGKIDFSGHVGGYTGGYRTGDAGELYVSNPVEGQVYAYGQKDYRGSNGGYDYVQYIEGEFVEVDKPGQTAALERGNRIKAGESRKDEKAVVQKIKAEEWADGSGFICETEIETRELTQAEYETETKDWDWSWMLDYLYPDAENAVITPGIDMLYTVSYYAINADGSYDDDPIWEAKQWLNALIEEEGNGCE